MPPAAHPLLDSMADEDLVVGNEPLQNSSASPTSSSMPSTQSNLVDTEPLSPSILKDNDSRHELFAFEDGSDHSGDDFGDIISQARKESIESIRSVSSSTITNSSIISTWSPTSVSETPTKKIKKKVRFPEQRAVQVIETIHVFDYTEEELAASFYNAREMRLLKRERRELARLLDQGYSPEEIEIRTGMYVRGIETACYDGNRRRHAHIAEGVHSVMLEQDMQYEDCKWNPSAIANIYHRASEESLVEAMKRGMEDEQEVVEELERIRQEYPSCGPTEC